MNINDLQQIRDFVLRALARYPRGVSAELLRTACSAAGMRLEQDGPDGLDAQLLYLEKSGLAQRLAKRHTSQLEMWGLTAAGDDYVRGM